MSQPSLRVHLNDLPPEGQTLTTEEKDLWQEKLNSFQMDCTLQTPLSAEIFLLRTEDGCLWRGKLQGSCRMPCSRCAEETEIDLNWSFEDFEPLPNADSTEQIAHEDARIHLEHGLPVLDLEAVLWEELVLALPATPLCSPTCKGLCVRCGANLNTGPCSCANEGKDPRMAIFRTLTLNKKKGS